jgi:hypothetical protein
MKWIVGLSMVVVWTTVGRAEITLYMNAWERLPQVQIVQGKNQNCEANRTIFQGPMPRNFRQSYPGTGSQGDDICVRRTADPLNPSSGWGLWSRCSSDGDCEIR